jgi:hypothetical protein
MSASLVCLVFFGCVILSALGFEALLANYVPAAENWVDETIGKYDAYFPEVRIRGGKASVSGKQPLFLDTGNAKDVVFVIDTNIDGIGEALKYLKDVHSGFVLTRTALVTKSKNQIHPLPFSSFPDMDLNSTALKAMKDRYFPALVPSMAFWSTTGAAAYFVVAFFYYLVAKTFQVLIFALVPVVLAGRYSMEVSYGQAVKIATVGLFPAVTLDFLLSVVGTWSPWTFGLYALVYLVTMVISVMDLAKHPEEPLPTVPIIRP